jgi:5-methylcytosine-specific restriction protein A
MPNKPMRICNYPGCNQLVQSGYCEKHKKQEKQRWDKQRQNVRERGYTTTWDKVSKRHKQLNPLCEECLKDNIVTVTQISHHIIPEQLCKQIGREDLIYDMDNLKADCITHHGKEKAIDDMWFEFAKTDSMQGTAKEIHARFNKRHGRGM